MNTAEALKELSSQIEKLSKRITDLEVLVKPKNQDKKKEDTHK